MLQQLMEGEIQVFDDTTTNNNNVFVRRSQRIFRSQPSTKVITESVDEPSLPDWDQEIINWLESRPTIPFVRREPKRKPKFFNYPVKQRNGRVVVSTIPKFVAGSQNSISHPRHNIRVHFHLKERSIPKTFYGGYFRCKHTPSTMAEVIRDMESPWQKSGLMTKPNIPKERMQARILAKTQSLSSNTAISVQSPSNMKPLSPMDPGVNIPTKRSLLQNSQRIENKNSSPFQSPQDDVQVDAITFVDESIKLHTPRHGDKIMCSDIINLRLEAIPQKRKTNIRFTLRRKSMSNASAVINTTTNNDVTPIKESTSIVKAVQKKNFRKIQRSLKRNNNDIPKQRARRKTSEDDDESFADDDDDDDDDDESFDDDSILGRITNKRPNSHSKFLQGSRRQSQNPIVRRFDRLIRKLPPVESDSEDISIDSYFQIPKLNNDNQLQPTEKNRSTSRYRRRKPRKVRKSRTERPMGGNTWLQVLDRNGTRTSTRMSSQYSTDNDFPIDNENMASPNHGGSNPLGRKRGRPRKHDRVTARQTKKRIRERRNTNSKDTDTSNNRWKRRRRPWKYIPCETCIACARPHDCGKCGQCTARIGKCILRQCINPVRSSVFIPKALLSDDESLCSMESDVSDIAWEEAFPEEEFGTLTRKELWLCLNPKLEVVLPEINLEDHSLEAKISI